MPSEWECPAGFPPLINGEVQVWRIELAEENVDEATYLRVLNPEETERSGRLRAGQVRLQFLAGRSCVRTLLGAHLGISPEAVPIVATEYGKPRLAPPFDGKAYFNVAHSRSTVLITMNLSNPVGIDIEYLDRKTEVEEVARHSLTEKETSIMLAIDDMTARSEFFFKRWTRKEAVVKADGRGLSLPLTSFEVSDDVSSRPLSVTIPGSDQISHRSYFVTDIPILEGTACAVATADQPSSLRLLKFPPVSAS